MTENKVQVFSLGVRRLKFEKRIKFIANEVLLFFRKRGLTLDVYLASANRMRLINERFRGKNSPANVLSFEAPPPGVFFEITKKETDDFKEIGEIYLCPSYISLNVEKWEKLLIHGVLHLLHYQHDKKNDTIEMEKLENKIYAKLGL